MQCINCQAEIGVRGNVCPYCHTIPYLHGSAPYSGIPPQGEITEAGLYGTALLFGVLGTFIFPPVGLGILGLTALIYWCNWNNGQ